MTIYTCNRTIVVAAFISVLVGCGGSSSDGDTVDSQLSIPDLSSDTRNVTILLTGVVVDAGTVSNLSYHTATQSGSTSATGRFNYADGEEVQFSLGGQHVGNTILAGAVITTPTIAVNPAAPTDTTPFINLTRLLQTLDVDADTDTGIEIASEAAQAVIDNGIVLDITQSESDFENDADVLTLITNAGQTITPSALVSTDQALTNYAANKESYYVGAWSISFPTGTNDTNIDTFIIFHDNNTFYFANIDESDFNDGDPCGRLGVEYGSYTSSVGQLDLVVSADTNGCKGLFDDSTTVTTQSMLSLVDVSANVFTFEIADEPGTTFTATRRPTSETDVVGLWKESGSYASLLYLPNGINYFIEDPSYGHFIDATRYTYDSLAAEITATLLFTSEVGPDVPPAGDVYTLTNVVISATQLQADIPAEGPVTFERVTPF
jgi:hypothetical protein